jgi:hypothetical protein
VQKSAIIIIAVLLVITSLSIGINIGLFWSTQSSVTSSPQPESYPSTVPAITPQPTANHPPGAPYNLSYTELSRETIGNDTRIVVTIKAQYNWGESVTINYQGFNLRVFIVQGGLALNMMINSDNVRPNEEGQVTINSSNSTANFQLSFEFPSMQYNSDGPVPFSQFGSYDIQYEGTTIS